MTTGRIEIGQSGPSDCRCVDCWAARARRFREETAAREASGEAQADREQAAKDRAERDARLAERLGILS